MARYVTSLSYKEKEKRLKAKKWKKIKKRKVKKSKDITGIR